MRPTHEIWALPLTDPWQCPRCGEPCRLGGTRSLWSLLPFVCVHQTMDWTMRIVAFGSSTDGLVRAKVERSYPVGTPCQVAGPLGLITQALQARLSHETKGFRFYWWLPMWSTSKGRELKRERRERRRQFRSRPVITAR